MIDRPTTFILGAGASMDFGFPSGKKLKQIVINMVSNSQSNAYRALRDLIPREERIVEFRDALFMSGRSSVDAFLEHRTDFINIGKIAMAIALFEFENASALFSAERNWYEHLFNSMSTSFENFAKNRVSIVTFNYDRSFEHFFFEALRNSYGVESPEMGPALGSIPIIHVHGNLGDLKWQGPHGRDYSTSLELNDIKEAASAIRIISELSEGEEAFKDAHRLLNESERIIILGFGFNPTNLARLKLPKDSGQKQFYASAYGLTELERHQVDGAFKPSTVDIGQSNMDSLAYLRERLVL